MEITATLLGAMNKYMDDDFMGDINCLPIF